MRLNHETFFSFFQKAGKDILDTLFPLRCLGCRTKGAWICAACEHRIMLRTEQHCPVCLRHITPTGEVCFSCRDKKKPALDGIFVASYYKEPLFAHALHTYKYRFIPHLSIPFGNMLKSALEKSPLRLPDMILPVPLHKKRLRFRGFNQSELIARELSLGLTPGLEIPLSNDILLRIRYTKPQMKTASREERLMNLKNAFALAAGKEDLVRGKYLWLVDDVATTGTTLEECATLLKGHGARTVFGIVLAR